MAAEIKVLSILVIRGVVQVNTHVYNEHKIIMYVNPLRFNGTVATA